jgi:hypothetical protein
MSERQDVSLDVEREKLELERAKVELEGEKLKVEKFKALWTGISIMVPLLVAVITIGFGVWSQMKQSQNQFEIQKLQAEIQSELQRQQARSQFEIKAAEIVMNTETPLGAQTKAKALANMFPDRLPSNFAASFDPDSYSIGRNRKWPRSPMRAGKPPTSRDIDQIKEWLNEMKRTIPTSR